jgi:hypothetical protein
MHKTTLSEPIASYLSKLPKYLFHIIAFGRYLSVETKNMVYEKLSSIPLLVVFYCILACIFAYAAISFKKMKAAGKVLFLYFTWIIFSLVFLFPVAFPLSGLLVFYDRYTYFVAPFIYLLLCLLAARYIHNKYVLILLFSAYFDVCLFFTIKVNTSWMDAERIDEHLLHNFPNDENKTVLLLNIPENMNGAPMIGAQSTSMFKIMSDLYNNSTPKNSICDVASYNMSTDYDGAHVKVLNDSMVRVSLNHGGNWWWYEGHGAQSYETDEYKVNMINVGYFYDLTLKHPADRYLLLFSVGDKWKKVDWDKKNVSQD